LIPNTFGAKPWGDSTSPGPQQKVQNLMSGRIQNKLIRRPPQSANQHNAVSLMQRPAEARGQRSSKPQTMHLRNNIGGLGNNNNFDMNKSPLSQTQIKDRFCIEDDDDILGGSIAYKDANGQGLLKEFGLID